MISPDLLLSAYAQGAFPMGMPDGEISWFSPDPRGILPLETFHIPHGLAKRLKKRPFEIRINTAFAEVMRGCADREETWIDSAIYKTYVHLHELGFAHSVEAWSENGLAGGLYGVALGGAFFGESMFSRETDASKIALHALVHRMLERNFSLLDIQWSTPHLTTFGAVEIPRKEYLVRLKAAIRRDAPFID